MGGSGVYCGVAPRLIAYERVILPTSATALSRKIQLRTQPKFATHPAWIIPFPQQSKALSLILTTDCIMTKYARRWLVLPIIIAVWVFAVGVGLRFVLAYENSPGAVGGVPKAWPADTRIQRAADLPTLVMMVHPHCPCSRASVGELSVLMAESQGRVHASVVFVRPLEFPDEWEKTDLWRTVAAIPGVKMSVDNGGVEAQRFGSKTSGQVMLYNPAGELLFSGGITSARGHSGENEGRSAIVALLAQGRTEKSETPVFGCSLFGETAKDKPEDFCNANHN